MNQPDPPYPTLAVFRAILIKDHGCFAERPPANLAYSPRQINILKRKTEDGTILECPPFPMDDNELMTRGMSIYICRHLRILPAKLNFLPDPVP